MAKRIESAAENEKIRRRQLVEQVASSTYFSKSARLREMFIYVCSRVLDHEAEEIHEQEVGRSVFGRPADYDTAADNTVRVHASMLRKRVEQYFANEGIREPLIIEIPRGNYAPVFHERGKWEPKEPGPGTAVAAPVQPVPPRKTETWRLWTAVAASGLFAALSLAQFLENRHLQRPATVQPPTVRQFWSRIFQPGRPTDLVIGDASLAQFEEQTGGTVALSEYFDRSYLTAAGDRAAAAKLNADSERTLLLKRQTNYGDVALLDPLTQIARAQQSDAKVRFARDYSFREIKADNAVLLGNVNSNPWIEPFQDHQTLRWKFDPGHASYYPVDTTAAAAEQDKFRQPAEGYAIVALFPNLGGTGNALIISGTGGSAMGGAVGFCTDERLMNQLRAQLNTAADAPFPYFEALLKIGSRNSLPRDSSVLIARRLRQ